MYRFPDPEHILETTVKAASHFRFSLDWGSDGLQILGGDLLLMV